MKPDHLLLLVLLAPKDGVAIFLTGSAGESITIKCTIGVYVDLGATFMFCRESCEGQDILISTDNSEKRRGRYSLTITKSFSEVTLKITIRSLRRSDSGTYQCGLKRTVLSDEFQTVTISVRDPVTTPRGADHEPSTPPGPTAPPPSSSTPTFTAPSSEPSQPTNRPRPPSPSGALISGGVALALLAALLLAALILCWRRSRLAPGSCAHTQGMAEFQAAEETSAVTYSQLEFASGRGSAPAAGPAPAPTDEQVVYSTLR